MGRPARLWQQMPSRRRRAGALLTAAWAWTAAAPWLPDLLGPVWWLGWAAIVVSGMAYAVVQGRRVCAWWRRQDDLETRAAAIQQTRVRAAGSTPAGQIYLGRAVGRARGARHRSWS